MTIQEVALPRLELDLLTVEPEPEQGAPFRVVNMAIGNMSPGSGDVSVPPGESIGFSLVAAGQDFAMAGDVTCEAWINDQLVVVNTMADSWLSVAPDDWAVSASSLFNQFDVRIDPISPSALAIYGSEQSISVRVKARYGTSNATSDLSWSFTVADTTPLQLIAAQSNSSKRVTLAFDDDVLVPPDALFIFHTVTKPGAEVRCISSSSSGRFIQLELDTETTFGAEYDVEVLGVTDELGNELANHSVRFTAYRPAWPARRRFSVWQHMISAQNRMDDTTGDLFSFAMCLQDIVDLLLLKIDEWPNIFDLTRAPEPWLDLILSDLGNPFSFVLSVQEKRKLASALVALYKLKGTEVGLVQSVLFLLDLNITISAPDNAVMQLGVSQLGVDWTLGASISWQRFSFIVATDRTLTADERSKLLAIIDYMRPVNTHLFELIEPDAPSDTPDHWELGRSELNISTTLH